MQDTVRKVMKDEKSIDVVFSREAFVIQIANGTVFLA